MQANRNTLESLRALARSLGVYPEQLREMARTAEHWELMPSFEHLTTAGAAQLLADLLKLQETRIIEAQLNLRIQEAHQVTT